MRSKKILTVFVFLAVLVRAVNFSAQAQPVSQWAADQKVPGYLADTFTPFLIADQNRTVHAFASQRIADGDRRLAIVYRKWSLAGGWTRPVDVLLASSGDATFLGAFLDTSGMTHVIFANDDEQNALIYYANAPVEMADSALAWSSPTVIGTDIADVHSASLAGDGQGNLVIIYSGNIDGSGVYAINSADAGQTWSDPLPIFLTQVAELIPFSLRLFVGLERQIRATWNVVTSLGVDQSLYFSTYDIPAKKWAKPLTLDERIDLPDYFGPSFPSIVDNGKEIVIMYNGGNPFPGRPVGVGRPVQRVTVSTDGGLVWSNPLNPFPFQLGRSGEHSLVLDGVGRSHALFVQRIESQVDGKYSMIAGIWHSTFQGNSWTNPDLLMTSLAPHDVRAVVVQGNVLLTVWREDPGLGKHGIWYSYLVLDNPELPIISLPTFNAPTTTVPPPLNSGTSSPVLLSTPTAMKLTDSEREIMNSNPSPAAPFIYGIIPVIFVLVGIIVIYRALRARR